MEIYSAQAKHSGEEKGICKFLLGAAAAAHALL